ncbi:MAG: NAD(P)H-dependent glycerol-3-phosphate dehydrogenase [Pseudomonadota bacterium]
MSRIVVVGAGAFGTALACHYALAGRQTALWGRNTLALRETRTSSHLQGFALPRSLEILERLDLRRSDTLLLAVPMQALDPWLKDFKPRVRTMIACCKGLDLKRLAGPSQLIAPYATECYGVLTGPSFAIDLAQGLPTALTLAVNDLNNGMEAQEHLSTCTMRLYLTQDMIGAEIGGALKNVVAIACGAAIAAGFGESARAALVARGLSEMSRFSQALGGRFETLQGLSGLGDLTLTCTSEKSRNYRAGLALASGEAMPQTTIEGIATTQAVLAKAQSLGLEMPIAKAVWMVADRQKSVSEALADLLERPLIQE